MTEHSIRKTFRRILKRAAVPMALAALMAMAPAAETSAATISELQQQKSQTESALSEAQSSASALESSQAAVSSSIDSTNDELVQNMASIQMLESEIADLDTQIAEKQQEYDDAVAEEQKQYDAMKLRIKYMYEKGDSSYMEVLVSATSFSDLLNKAQYVDKLYEYDRNMLDQYEQIQAQVKQDQQDLQDAKDEQEESKLGLESEQAALNNQLAQLQAQYDDYETRIANAQAEATKLAAQLTEQTNAIAAAEEAQRKAEAEAAAKKAAEEAAAKEKARQQAATAASSTSSSSSTASSGTSVTVTDNTTTTTTTSTGSGYTVSNYTYTPSTSSGSTPSNSSGVTGQDVVNYAVQFVGNPYVYGGTSLTNGTDCSGYTMSVYAHFGYSLGRTDVAQRSNGIAVSSLADALPGDIICYPGHVALYIGNGMIVHASTPSTGIKYSSATYRSYVCIRRIIY